MTHFDWIILVLYALTVAGLGAHARRREEGLTGFFLAGRRQGWFSVAASTWATSLSALTFIGVPGAALAGNFAYAQLWVGTFLAAYLVAILFLPHYYKLGVFTVYAYLEHRFGWRTRFGAAIVFLISRCLASAVRLAGCAIAVSVFFGLSFVAAIALITVIATAYVLAGGLRAVMWTDMLQLGLFLVGAAAAVLAVIFRLPDGLPQLIEIGMQADKFRLFDFTPSLSDPGTFWIGNLFAMLLGLAVGATDQDIAQRALSCRTLRQGQIGVVASGFGSLLSTLLFLTVGLCLYAYYRTFPDPAVATLIEAERYDHVFPHFIRHDLPSGLRGLLIASLFAAAMSSLDSALNGLASSAYFDLRPGPAARRTDMALAHPRRLVLLFAALLSVLAIGFGSQPSILWFGLQIMGYTYGGLLGIFLVGVLSEKLGHDTANLVAMVSSMVVVTLAVHWGFGFGPIPWPWGIVLGMGWTVAVILIASGLSRPLSASPKP